MKRKIRNLTILFLCLALSPIVKSADRDQIIKSHNNRIVAPEGVSYQWYFNGEKLKGLDHQEIKVMMPGIYSVEVMDSAGTTTLSEAKIVLDEGKVVVIYLIGDSTMADYEAYYTNYEDYIAERYPVTGWGQVFQEFMHSDSLPKLAPFIQADSVIIDNHARGGRSTRTFWEEGRWTTVYNLIDSGDYVIIQFGHNDAAVDYPDRYVDTAGYKDFLRLYVNETREKGGIPILATPVNRNYNWVGGELTNIHGNYPGAMKEVADELHVPLIDVTQRSLDYFTEVGREYVTDHFFMNLEPGVYEAYPDGEDDNTHFQPEGARAVSKLVYEGLQDVRELHITSTPNNAGKVEGKGWYEEKYDSVVTIKAYPKKGFVFDSWSGDATGQENPITVSLDASKKITAHFKSTDQAQYYLNTNTFEEGTIHTNPFGKLFLEDQNVMLNVQLDEGYDFYAWTGDYHGSDNPVTITIDDEKTIHAVLKEDDETIIQAESAIESGQLEHANLFYTGSSYSVLENLNDSLVWEVQPLSEGRFGISFRYTHEAEDELIADLYVNDELIREDMVFDSIGNLEVWQHTGNVYERMETVNNKIKLVFNGDEGPLYIDYIKFKGRAVIGEPTAIQNYNTEKLPFTVVPNPFAHQAKLEFNLEKLTDLRIDIYTLNGQKMQTIAQGEYQAGNYQMIIGSGLSRGVYSLQFDQGGIYSSSQIIVY